MSRKRKAVSWQASGFSLVELVIVIAIITILVGVTSLGIGLIRSNDPKNTAYSIENGLKKLKSVNMAGEKMKYLHIYMDGGKYYKIFTDSVSTPSPDGTEKEIGNSSVSLKVTYEVKSETGVPLPDRVVTLSESGTKEICIGISKKDGSFLTQEVSGGTGNSKEAPREILVTSSSSTGYLVYMVTDTGKHYVEAK